MQLELEVLVDGLDLVVHAESVQDHEAVDRGRRSAREIDR